jgi:hypothetical protein
MSEINHRLGDRLRTLVEEEDPSPTLRSDIEAQLRQPVARSKTAPKILALAAVVAALVVGTVALAGSGGSSGSDQQVFAVPPPVPVDSTLAPTSDLPHGRSSTRLLTADATRTPGTADAARQRLEAAGYIGVGSLDAPQPAAASGVYFAPGYEAEALDVARLLGLGESAVNRTPPPYPEPNGADVLLVVGDDLVGTPASPPAPAS